MLVEAITAASNINSLELVASYQLRLHGLYSHWRLRFTGASIFQISQAAAYCSLLCSHRQMVPRSSVAQDPLTGPKLAQ